MGSKTAVWIVPTWFPTLSETQNLLETEGTSQPAQLHPGQMKRKKDPTAQSCVVGPL